MGSPSYQDFEPYCERQRDEGQETLVLHLPEFKRDQLKVQVNDLGILKISGERPLDGDHGSRKSRFYKETVLPPGYKISEIRAKFTGGRLNITMPRKSSPPPPPPPPAAAAAAVLQPAEQTWPARKICKPDDHKVPSVAKGLIRQSSGGGGGLVTEPPSVPEPGSSIEEITLRMTVKRVGVGVAIAAVVAIGVYAAFKYHSSCSTSSSHPTSTSDYS